MSFVDFVLFAAIGFFSSVVGAISTGAGFITIPSMILMGVSPQQSIATSRLGGIITTASGLMKFHKEKKIQWRYLKVLVPLSIIASFVGGTAVVRFTNQEALENVIAGILLLLIPLVLWKKNSRRVHVSSRKNELVAYSLYFLIMSFAAFFTGGSGALVLLVFAHFFGLQLVEANATSHAAWIFMQIVTSIIFLANGLVRFDVFVPLAIGNLFGGYAGAHLAIKKGDRFISVLLCIVIVAAALRMLLD